MLDERTLAESRRVRQLAAEIKRLAARHVEQPLADEDFCTVEGPPEVRLVMEKPLWEPTEVVAFSGRPEPIGAAALDDLSLFRLYKQFAVDEALLRRRIEMVLQRRPAVTLAALLEYYPARQGLTEILAYLAIAARETRHSISETDTEEIVVAPLAEEGGEATLLTVPQVTYRSRSYVQ